MFVLRREDKSCGKLREIDRHLEEGLDQRVGERLYAFRSSMPPDLEVLGLERLNDLNESSRGLLMILRAELAYCVCLLYTSPSPRD